MNISKYSFITRLLCCFLACLILCGSVMRPITAEATVAGATAGLAYVTIDAVIPWLLSILSVGYLVSYGSSLFYSVKDAISEWAVTSSLGQSLKTYSYGSDYYLDSAVVDAATVAVNDYLAGDFATACEIGSAFSKAFVITYSIAGDTYTSYYWGNSKPTYYYDDPYLILQYYKPGVQYHLDHLFDYSSDESSRLSCSISGGTLVSIETVAPSSLTKSDVSDVAEQLATTGIWVVDATGGDNDNGKRHYLPVIPTKDIDSSDVEITSTQVEVDTSPSSSSSTDLSGITGLLSRILSGVTSIPEFLTNYWTDFKTGVLEIPEILVEIKTWIQDIPETLTQIWEWIKTLPSVLYNSVVDALEYLFVPTDGYLDWRVDLLRASFPLFDSIIDSAIQLRSLFNFATSPPIIYIDLGASTSWAMGGRTVFIDMSWYAQYKPTMDLVISVFLWLFFLWRVFLALPGIISGTSGFWGSGSVESTKTSGCTDITIIR